MDDEEQLIKKQNILAKRLSRFNKDRRKLATFFRVTKNSERAYSIILNSNKEEDTHNTLIIQLGVILFKFALPRIIKPLQVGVYKTIWGTAETEKKRWTYAVTAKVYGIGYLPKERVFHFFYGVQSGNAYGFPSDKFKVWIPPFVKYKLTSHRIIGKDDEVFWENTKLNDKVRQSRLACNIIGMICPKIRFKAIDCKGKEVLGSAYVEEKQWSRGVYIFDRFIYTSKNIKRKVLCVHLQLESDDPTGKPTSETFDFTMLTDETIAEAVKRFCQHKTDRSIPRCNIDLVEVV